VDHSFAGVLLLFGAKKIPELAGGLGQGIKEFKRATKEVTTKIQNAPAQAGKSPAVTASQPCLDRFTKS